MLARFVAELSDMDAMESLLCVLEEAQRIASDSNWCTPKGIEALLSSPKAPPNVAHLYRDEAATKKPKNWKKPKDMPRRPLSAYNLFFKSERQRIVASISEGPNPRLGRSGKAVGIGFAGLARDIASKWKVLDNAEKSVFEEQAKVEKLRYRQEMSVWRSTQAPKQKSKKPVTNVSPTLKATSAVVMNLDRSTFEASDDTSQSLRQIMQDALCLSSQFRKRNGSPDWGPNSPVTLPESDQVISMTFPGSGAMVDSSPRCGPAVISPLLDEYHTSLNDEGSCWKELAANLHSEFHAHETFDDSLDELTNFMEKMERDYF